MRAVSFGSYCPGDSVIHRLDPRMKLVAGFCLLIIALASSTAVKLGMLAVAIVVLYAIARVPASRALRSLAPLLPIVALVSVLRLFTDQSGSVIWAWGVFRVSEGSASSFAATLVRLTAMMAGMSLVTLTTTTLDLTAAFERLLAPLRRAGAPVHELGMMLGIALRFMPQFAQEMAGTYEAQVSRGAGLSASPVRGVRMALSVAVPLFASVFRHAETLSEAMDARCYHGEQGRTRLHELRFSQLDVLAAACVAVLAIAVVMA